MRPNRLIVPSMPRGVKSRAPTPLPAPAPWPIISARPACDPMRADRRRFHDRGGQVAVYRRAGRIGSGPISAIPTLRGNVWRGPRPGRSRHGGHRRPAGDRHQSLSPGSPCLHHRARTTGKPFHERWTQGLARLAVGCPPHQPSQYVRPAVGAAANRVSSAPSAEPPSSGTARDADEKSPWTQISATTVPAWRRRGPCRSGAVKDADFRTARRPKPASGVALVCWPGALNAVLSPQPPSIIVPGVASTTPASLRTGFSTGSTRTRKPLPHRDGGSIPVLCSSSFWSP